MACKWCGLTDLITEQLPVVLVHRSPAVDSVATASPSPQSTFCSQIVFVDCAVSIPAHRADTTTPTIEQLASDQEKLYTWDIDSNQEGEGEEGDDANEEMGRGSVGVAPVVGWQQQKHRLPSRRFFLR